MRLPGRNAYTTGENGRYSEDRMITRDARYLTDLDRCLPAAALSPTPTRGRWRMLEYETEHFRGTMLTAGEETLPPGVTYPLDVSGVHRISIGLYGDCYNGDTVVQVRLTGDPAFTVLTLKEGPDRTLYDLYWKTADLTGRQITFVQLFDAFANGEGRMRRGRQAMIAYIKLEPVAEIERPRPEHQRLYAHNDAHGFTYLFGVTTPEEIYREIEPYRNSDFSRLYWEAGMGDLLYYPGTVGRQLTCAGHDDFWKSNARIHAESWRTMLANGVDQLRLAAEMTHGIGLEFHAAYRMGGFRWPPPEDYWNGPGFFTEHPELRAVLRDGRRAERISYSFPETRRFACSLLREVAENYPIDGVCLIYVRRPPFVDYEPPLVDGFRAEFSLDPRELPEDDPRWLEYRCRVLTGFMREVREEMDAVARARGRKRLAITAIVSGRREENVRDGIKVEDWIAAGTVDTLIPYTMAPGLDSSAVSFPDARDAAYWAGLAKGTACEVPISVLPRFMTPEEYRRTAAGYYGAGAETLFFWDCAYHAYNNQYAWNTMRRLGHREEIAAWMQSGQPEMPAPTVPLLSLGGWNLADDTPG